VRSFIISTHPQIALDRSFQGECCEQGMWHAWERREKCTRFWWERQKERDHLKDQGMDERMGSEWILGTLAWGVDWIRMSQDRDQWIAVVNAVMNIRVLMPRSQLSQQINRVILYLYTGKTVTCRCLLFLSFIFL
jgi:hypothetical protein